MDAQSYFRELLADLQRQLNPDDISGHLYSAALLTQSEHDEVNNTTLSDRVRITKLLSAVEKAIRIDAQNFSTFLNVLDKTPQYQPIARRARKKLRLQQQPSVGTSVGTSVGAAAGPLIGICIVVVILAVAIGINFRICISGICIVVVILAVAIFYFSMESKVSSVESMKNWMTTIGSKKSLIQEVAPKVNAKWKRIGRHLGISKNVLNDIQSQVARMPDSNMRAFELMVEKWKNLKTSNVVIETFITALGSPEVGEVEVAKYMRDKIEAMAQKLKDWLLTITAQAYTKWRLVGEQLGISSNDLDSIQSEFAGRPDVYRFQQVLSIYGPTRNYDAYRKLIDALDKVGENTKVLKDGLEDVLIAIKI